MVIYAENKKYKYKWLKLKIEFIILSAKIKYTKVNIFYVSSLTENKIF